MFLSKLQILGFKSFPQKTELHFDRGVTSIVGPNGCGKTNLLDAIRWVLGEQRTTLLRSSKMEDVIFNGTKDLKPLGMAEVTLVIENSQGILPIDYSQVTVTRRLFRSGESEYLLNKTPCRLKDITELFLDTGVGIHAYSVIQPEMVEAILSDKAEERRFLFEEAAGITKYKLRKREAERKLEQTENDLLRLGDILSEVEKQVNSLRRQKGKAERYKRLTQQIKEVEIKLSQHEFRILKTKEAELEERLKISTDQSQETTSELDKEEAEVEDVKLKLLEIEKETGGIQKKIGELSEKSFQIERDISINRERKTNLEKLIQRNDHELENLRIRLTSEENQRQEKGQKLSQLVLEIDAKRKDCETEETALLVSDEKLRQMKEKLQKLTGNLQESNEDLSRQRGEKSHTETQIEELRHREKLFTEEMRTLESKIEGLSHRLAELSSEDENKKRELEARTEKTDLLKEKVSGNQSKLTDLTSEEGRIRSLLEGEKARLQMLRQISEHYEGYGKGERWVLSSRERLPGVVDTVANLITAQTEHIKAVESALGEAAQFIVCQNTQSAVDAIQQLKEEKAGRATFIPLDKVDALKVSSTRSDLSRRQGVTGWASELVQCQPGVKKVIDTLLGNVILVRSLNEALQLAPEIGPGFDLVTLEGEIIRALGALSGGSPQDVSLLGREPEIQGLDKKVAQLVGRLDQVETEKKDSEDEGEKLQEILSQITAETQKISRQIQQSEIELKTLQFEKGSLESRKGELEELSRGTKNRISELTRKMGEQDAKIQELADNKEKLLLLVEEEKQTLENTEASHSETFKKANQLKIELVSLQGKDEQIRSEEARLSELIAEIKDIQAAKTKESEDSGVEIEKIAQITGEREKELKEVFQQIEQDKAELSSRSEEQSRWQEELSEKEKSLKASRGTKDRVLDQLHQLKMEQVGISSQARNIKNRISEEYRIDLEELEIPAEVEPEDTESLRQDLNAHKEKLKSIGAVNLLALEEYESAKERLDFLQNQVKDLTEAKETLTSTIAKINNTARTLFLQTFEQIKLNFQKVFEELFEGGETELTLVDSGDPLESPVQVSARPYGKRLLNISQLSGGEKALTAIALLFAIYLVKPSPFCILDEVDAPLDDANITRFLKLIRHFSSTTQFILITHNKLTMEAADILYGVTMEQPGVSKIVSVKFDKREIITTQT